MADVVVDRVAAAVDRVVDAEVTRIRREREIRKVRENYWDADAEQRRAWAEFERVVPPQDRNRLAQVVLARLTEGGWLPP